MPDTTRVRVTDPGALLSVVPLLIGYQPAEGDTVILGTGDNSQVVVALRLDADAARSMPPGEVRTMLANARAAGVRSAVVIGYGSNVTPAVDRIRGLVAEQLPIREALRADGSRYWSYECRDPRCCPPEGRVFAAESEASTRLRAEGGLAAATSRQQLASRLAGPAGDQATSADRAWQRAVSQPLTMDEGRHAVQAALAASYQGRQLGDDELARLAAAMRHLEVRDDAWARMTPDKAGQHQALWSDAVRRLPDQAVVAPATMLAWTAWQQGDGAQANIALDRALAADPGYSIARLLQAAVSAGMSPSHAVPPLTPEQVARSYARREDRQAQAGHHTAARAGHETRDDGAPRPAGPTAGRPSQATAGSQVATAKQAGFQSAGQLVRVQADAGMKPDAIGRRHEQIAASLLADAQTADAQASACEDADTADTHVRDLGEPDQPAPTRRTPHPELTSRPGGPQARGNGNRGRHPDRQCDAEPEAC